MKLLEKYTKKNKINNMGIEDLNKEYRVDTIQEYIDTLMAEFSKLQHYLEQDRGLGNKTKADFLQDLNRYIYTTKLLLNQPVKEEENI